MSQHLRDQWWGLQRTAAPTSWRPVADSNPTAQADCVILTQYVGTRRYFEVYTYGVAFANRPSLDEAKAAVEEIYGPLEWARVDVPKTEVYHYYFGPTDEFSDPTTLYTAALPRLGATGALPGRTAAYDGTMIARGLHVYVGIDAHAEMIPALLAGTVTARDVLRLMDADIGIWWGVMGSFGDLVDFEDYAYSDGLLADTYADLDGGDVSIVLIAQRPARNGEPWDPEIHNPIDPLMGNSYLHRGEAIDLVEVRYNSGDGWHSLPATGIRTTARRTAGPAGNVIPDRLKSPVPPTPAEIHQGRPVVLDRPAEEDLAHLPSDVKAKLLLALDQVEQGIAPLEPKTRDLLGAFTLRLTNAWRAVFYFGAEKFWHLFAITDHDYDEVERRFEAVQTGLDDPEPGVHLPPIMAAWRSKDS